MKTQLTQQRLKDLLHYDIQTGQFHWKVSPHPSSAIKPGAVAGAAGRIRINGIQYNTKQLAALYLHGDDAFQELRANMLRGRRYTKLLKEMLARDTTIDGPAVVAAAANALNEITFDSTYVPSEPANPVFTAEQEMAIERIVNRVIERTVSGISFSNLTAAFPELAKLLADDLFGPTIYCPPAPTPEELEAAANLRLAKVLAEYAEPLLTAPLLAELSDVPYDSKPKNTWAAILRHAGWTKLGHILKTKHANGTAIYCRKGDVADWATKSVVELRAGLPDGIYAGFSHSEVK